MKKSIKKSFAIEVLSIPTISGKEDKIIDFIKKWAIKNNIKVEQDRARNLYLTKGSVKKGEFYPCTTSHLDTVQPHYEYILRNEKLPLIIEKINKKTIIKTNNAYGVGADCKIGIVVCLSLFKYFDKLKCALFVEEETGMLGSDKLNLDFFKDVGYVIGFDSPELNRASYSSNGVKLFDERFFCLYLKYICFKHGVFDFRSEPYTDICKIREKTGLVCMNFGSGGYMPHSYEEYVVLEDTNSCFNMSIDLIKFLNNRRF